jgi:hypothetical protein
MTPNPAVKRTACKLRLQVTSALARSGVRLLPR